MYVYLCMYFCLSLSLYIYIYIYIGRLERDGAREAAVAAQAVLALDVDVSFDLAVYVRAAVQCKCPWISWQTLYSHQIPESCIQILKAKHPRLDVDVQQVLRALGGTTSLALLVQYGPSCVLRHYLLSNTSNLICCIIRDLRRKHVFDK